MARTSPQRITHYCRSYVFSRLREQFRLQGGSLLIRVRHLLFGIDESYPGRTKKPLRSLKQCRPWKSREVAAAGSVDCPTQTKLETQSQMPPNSAREHWPSPCCAATHSISRQFLHQADRQRDGRFGAEALMLRRRQVEKRPQAVTVSRNHKRGSLTSQAVDFCL
jgi:hypothetical protein